VGPGRTIEGDFQDDEIAKMRTPSVLLRLIYGAEPYRVVEKARQYAQSKCKYSPYDAIVQWGTVVESNRLQVPLRLAALRSGRAESAPRFA
jgi:hypothetical protein